MTYQGDITLPSELLEQITVQGFDVHPDLIRIVINAAMQAERQQHLKAAPYQHSLAVGVTPTVMSRTNLHVKQPFRRQIRSTSRCKAPQSPSF